MGLMILGVSCSANIFSLCYTRLMLLKPSLNRMADSLVACESFQDGILIEFAQMPEQLAGDHAVLAKCRAHSGSG